MNENDIASKFKATICILLNSKDPLFDTALILQMSTSFHPLN